MGEQAIRLVVNGTERALTVSEDARLLDVLRDQLHLYGTKEGCGSGECGACTVIMNRRLVSSCLVFAVQADGSIVTTIEGLGTADHPHPVQAAFLETAAVQCGYCAPGMVLAAVDLLGRKPRPTDDDIRGAIAGNICRCTGYAKILEAVHLASERMSSA